MIICILAPYPLPAPGCWNLCEHRPACRIPDREGAIRCAGAGELTGRARRRPGPVAVDARQWSPTGWSRLSWETRARLRTAGTPPARWGRSVGQGASDADRHPATAGQVGVTRHSSHGGGLSATAYHGPYPRLPPWRVQAHGTGVPGTTGAGWLREAALSVGAGELAGGDKGRHRHNSGGSCPARPVHSV